MDKNMGQILDLYIATKLFCIDLFFPFSLPPRDLWKP